MKVVWTMQAEQQLAEIEDFIARDSPERAAAFIEKLIERGDRILLFPKAGRPVPELGGSAVREVLESSYRIVYRLSSHAVQILTVFEGHRRLRSKELESSAHRNRMK